VGNGQVAMMIARRSWLFAIGEPMFTLGTALAPSGLALWSITFGVAPAVAGPLGALLFFHTLLCGALSRPDRAGWRAGHERSPSAPRLRPIRSWPGCGSPCGSRPSSA
jgi:hypothetical protein